MVAANNCRSLMTSLSESPGGIPPDPNQISSAEGVVALLAAGGLVEDDAGPSSTRNFATRVLAVSTSAVILSEMLLLTKVSKEKTTITTPMQMAIGAKKGISFLLCASGFAQARRLITVTGRTFTASVVSAVSRLAAVGSVMPPQSLAVLAFSTSSRTWPSTLMPTSAA